MQRKRPQVRSRLGAGLALALWAAACGEPPRFDPTELGGWAIDVHADGAVVRHGRIGSGRFESRGTYVLVDVDNPLSVDLDVTLEGDLVDAHGDRIGALNRDALRIPARDFRTFALVHHDGEVPAATGADIRVVDARIARFPADTVRMHDTHGYRDEGRAVVAANFTNEGERETIVVVIAAFYDRDGHIMSRPHTILRIPSGVTHPARFVGPPGSDRGYMFLGEQVW
ncbi:MAG: hypothetical protein D6689_00950 [Deltaproteobacteria bacterium]|nr:MAG: hypothetical protein D6689_00950 [Deltaproteobacteria bacterium]